MPKIFLLSVGEIGSAKRDDNDVIDWIIDEAPVVVELSVDDNFADVGTGVTLSYREYQSKGTEYETTILIDEGNRSITDYNVTIALFGATGKQYILNEDYSYDDATGKVTIPNLNETVIISVYIVDL